MLRLILVYLILPFVLAALVLRFIRKYGATTINESIRQLYSDRPLEKRWFRAIRRDQKGIEWLADLEKHQDAVDCAYKSKEEAQASGRKASFLVLNDKGETLEEIAS